jgi:hypothetical protein
VLTRRQEKVLQFSRAEGGFRPRGSDIATIRVLELKGLVDRIEGGKYIATELGANLPDRISPLETRMDRIVSFLRSGGEGLQTAEIADALKISRPLIYPAIRMLRETGAVTQGADPQDAGDKRIFLVKARQPPRKTS